MQKIMRQNLIIKVFLYKKSPILGIFCMDGDYFVKNAFTISLAALPRITPPDFLASVSALAVHLITAMSLSISP